MKRERNKLMLLIAGSVTFLAIVINILGRYFHLFDFSHGGMEILTSYEIEEQFGGLLNILLAIPIILFLFGVVLYKKNRNHIFLPYLLTLVLTFASIAIISGGSGRVEFHFSIFMVVAALGFYQEIKQLIMMTSIFAVQHIVGLLLVPEIVFGVKEYMFSMFLLHALFLVLTSSAVSWQVHSGRKIEQYYQKEQEEQRMNIVEDIVGRLAVTSNQILQVSETLSHNAKVSSDSSAELAASIEEVASITESQLVSIEENVEAINFVHQGIQTINQTAQSVSVNSNATAEESQKGSNQTEVLLSQMEEIDKEVDESYHAIKELHQRSQAIEGIIEVITGIADQTNLLALNAAIESARAGEYGKGFAVVASEVRSLAEQSLESSEHIAEIIKQMIIDTNYSVASINNVKTSTVEGLELAKKSNNVFQHISKSSNEVAAQIQGISSLVEEITTSSEQMNRAMEAIEQSVNQSSSGAKEITSITEKQNNEVQNTLDVSKKLNDLTVELNQVIHALKA